MSYSEDSITPSAPFTGDGSVFDQPDVVLGLPTTTERVVDTQSGFLLVVRRLGDRLALYCKRRVGTPPSSAILLTPDESLKLSKVLAASLNGLEDSGDQSISRSGSGSGLPGRRKIAFVAQTARPSGVFKRIGRPALSALAIACVFAAGLFTAHLMGISKTVAAQPQAVDALSTSAIDRFARAFVGQMLDFNPSTYRASQLRAMASMAPDLVDKYCQQTSFPLSGGALKKLPQGTSVVIDRIDQDRSGADTATAFVSAQLVHSDSKLASPIRLKLKLGLGTDGAIQVLDQEDLSGLEAH